ncbi:OsmC family protein [Nocardia sp. CDC159]|uniref:OsmC family protein n=1 Tax=Nocardia pulmonis TaxID=2951408 RepID=A0A9X2EB18_9NOCA|nr:MULTISPECIES: OsmC family protein [Nocardia]MCM6776160.1 OsmC family protein [Nocardia pulmonis]MCM6788513.1 OsmC family protein [Nocardia sp. CDC159]
MTTEVGTPLNDITAATARAVAQDPAAAAVVFRASGRPEGTVATLVTAGHHTVRVDEPPNLGGADTAANPVEVYLAALIACHTVTYRFWAQRLGIVVADLAIEAEGDLDVRGFFGLDDAVRPGLQAVRVTVRIDGPEPAERYAELHRAVESHCPVLDLTAAPTPVESRLITGAAAG